MEALTEDTELEFELQEIYLTGKQWLADLAFMDNEHAFLTKLLAGEKSPARHMEEGLRSAMLEQHDLHKDILHFINKIEQLIVVPGAVIGLSLIDDFISLQTRVGCALLAMKDLKLALTGIRRAA